MFGSIGLESSFGALNTVLGTELAVQALTSLKERFGVPSAALEEGEVANITLFDPEPDYEFSEKDIRSTSMNSAMLGKKLKGRAYGIYSNKKLVLNK